MKFLLILTIYQQISNKIPEIGDRSWRGHNRLLAEQAQVFRLFQIYTLMLRWEAGGFSWGVLECQSESVLLYYQTLLSFSHLAVVIYTLVVKGFPICCGFNNSSTWSSRHSSSLDGLLGLIQFGTVQILKPHCKLCIVPDLL